MIHFILCLILLWLLATFGYTHVVSGSGGSGSDLNPTFQPGQCDLGAVSRKERWAVGQDLWLLGPVIPLVSTHEFTLHELSGSSSVYWRPNLLYRVLVKRE